MEQYATILFHKMAFSCQSNICDVAFMIQSCTGDDGNFTEMNRTVHGI